MNEDNQVEIRYSSYTPAQKKATQKYRQLNKDKVNEQRKKYYQQRKENDPEFLEYKRAKAREYYLKQKERRTNKNSVVQKEPVPEPIPEPEPVIEVVAEPIPEIVLEQVTETKVKKTRTKKVVDPEKPKTKRTKKNNCGE